MTLLEAGFVAVGTLATGFGYVADYHIHRHRPRRHELAWKALAIGAAAVVAIGVLIVVASFIV